MSEEVQYSTSVRSEDARQRFLESLRRRGVVFRNKAAWEAARRGLESSIASERLGRNASSSLTGAFDIVEAYRRFERDPVLGTVAASIHGPELAELSEAVKEMRSPNDLTGNHLDTSKAASLTRQRLEEIESSCRRFLQEVQEDVLLESADQAMRDLGYSSRRRGSALRGVKGQTCVWAQAEGDRLTLDLSGFSGLTCLEALQRIERALRRQGLVLDRTGGMAHARREGGELARKLGRQWRATAPTETATTAVPKRNTSKRTVVARREMI